MLTGNNYVIDIIPKRKGTLWAWCSHYP